MHNLEFYESIILTEALTSYDIYEICQSRKYILKSENFTNEQFKFSFLDDSYN